MIIQKKKKGKAYSDHAPIEAILPPTQPPAPVSQGSIASTSTCIAGTETSIASTREKEDNATKFGLFFQDGSVVKRKGEKEGDELEKEKEIT